MSRKKLFINFQPSEMAVYKAAADIFSSYVVAGRVTEANERDYMLKSVSQAMLMAEFVENVVISDDEVDPDER